MSYRITKFEEVGAQASPAPSAETPSHQMRDTAIGITIMVGAAVVGSWIYDRYFRKPHRRKLYEKNTLR